VVSRPFRFEAALIATKGPGLVRGTSSWPSRGLHCPFEYGGLVLFLFLFGVTSAAIAVLFCTEISFVYTKVGRPRYQTAILALVVAASSVAFVWV